MTDPRKPRAEEVAVHEKTHLAFRNWCRHCVKGSGKEAPHLKQPAGHPIIPEAHLDLMSLGEEGEPGNTASVMPNKSMGHFLSISDLPFLKEIG